MKIYVLGGKISDEEKEAYTKTIQEKYPDREIESITITVDGDYVDCKTHFVPDRPFDRIRRITGYLVPNLKKWNDGKRAEERDRVKHNISSITSHAGDL